MIADNAHHQCPACLFPREQFGGTMELKLPRATNIPLSRITRAGGTRSWLSWGWNSWVVWPGWMDRADTFYTVWDQKVAEKGRKWHLLQEAFLTDYFGTFVQVDPPQEQKFLDEMSLSLAEEIHKTHKFRKRKLCFLLLSQPVPHLFLRVSIFLSHCSVRGRPYIT